MRSAFLAAGVACLALPSLVQAQPKEPEGAAGGKIIFAKICASCHGTDARGGGPVAESLKTPPSDLTEIAARREGVFEADEVAAIIDGRRAIGAHGPREMPVWGDSLAHAVGDEELREERIDRAIRHLVEFLETIQE
jgi:mono/diheme cytochrome c family protein